jgi:protein-disulfide isomerase
VPNNPSKISRKAAIREQRRKKQLRDRLIIISIISLVAIIAATLLITANLPINPDRIVKPEIYERPATDGMAVGNPNAPVMVEEFSDFKCIHCRNFWEEAEKRLIDDYVAQGLVYFRYTPMSFLSPESFKAAEAAYCAMDQGKFWEYHDYIFANFGVELSDPMLRGFARELNLDTGAFDRCYNNGQYRQQVLDDVRYANGKGVTSTPTFEVNGQLVDRVSLFDIIDEELQN